jgi:hypothetical protein
MSEKPFLPTPEALLKGREQPDLVDVPSRLVLALDGTGGPEQSVFSAAIAALYGISYTLRFGRKKAGHPVFKVGVLEGEWRVAGEDSSIHEIPSRDAWRWRLQICVPHDVTEEELRVAVETATTKRGGKLEGSEQAQRIELLGIEPARFARVLHVGPYSTELESFAKIDQFLAKEGLGREPWHVEVYLSDPSRTAPEKLKTGLLTKIS